MKIILQRLTISSIALIAGLIVLQNSTESHAVTSFNQIDQLKAQFLPAEYRNTNFTIDDIKKVYREKCKKVSGRDNSTLYREIEKSATALTTCLSSIASLSALQEEINLARPIGELDTVFNKYCQLVPKAENCLITFNSKLQPCLTTEEKKQNSLMVRIVSSLAGFMCSRGGDQIALFVAEDGPECFDANKEAINACVNSSFSEFLPKDGSIPSVNDLPELILSPEHCVDFEKFEKCTLHHLEQCQEITPANVAESVFRYIKNETSCKSWMDAKSNERSVLKQPRNGAISESIHSVMLIFATVMAIFSIQLF